MKCVGGSGASAPGWIEVVVRGSESFLSLAARQTGLPSMSILQARVVIAAVSVLSAAALSAACSSSAKPVSTDAGGAGGGGSGGAADHPVAACSDPQPWSAPPAPGACADAPPTPPSGVATVTLAVDAASVVRPWNRFYEKTVASDHAHTVLCTAYGRNIQNALRKAHAQAGFQYVRFHALFDDDDAVYTEDALGGPIYDWSSIDAIEDAIIAAGMRPLVEISFTPSALAATPSMTLSLLWYDNVSPNISPPTGGVPSDAGSPGPRG